MFLQTDTLVEIILPSNCTRRSATIRIDKKKTFYKFRNESIVI